MVCQLTPSLLFVWEVLIVYTEHFSRLANFFLFCRIQERANWSTIFDASLCYNKTTLIPLSVCLSVVVMNWEERWTESPILQPPQPSHVCPHPLHKLPPFPATSSTLAGSPLPAPVHHLLYCLTPTLDKEEYRSVGWLGDSGETDGTK